MARYLIILALFFSTNSVSFSKKSYLSKSQRQKYEYKTSSKRLIKDFEEAMGYYNRKNFAEAFESFQSIFSQDSAFSHNTFYLAKTNYALKDFEIAIEYFTKYLELNTDEPLLRNEAKNLLHASNKKIELEDHGVITASEEHINLGEVINSEADELFPYLDKNERTLYFLKVRRKDDINPEETASIYFSEKSPEGAWSVPKKFEFIDENFYVGSFSIHEGSTMTKLFFSSCENLYGLGGCDIYLAIKKGDKWFKPFNLLSSMNSIGFDAQPSISADGTKLYFSSDRKGGFGKQDLWVSEKNELGLWSAPRNLGGTINSFGSEQSPLIHSDGQTLYFSSNSFTSFGGFDIYRSQMDEFNFFGKDWIEVKNVGLPVNSVKDDLSIFISRKGEKAYTVSNYLGGFGGYDIFSFDISKNYLVRPPSTDIYQGQGVFSKDYEDLIVSGKHFIGSLPLNFSTHNLTAKQVYDKFQETQVSFDKNNIDYSQFQSIVPGLSDISTNSPLVKYMVMYNDVYFTRDGKFFEMNGQFFSIDNRLRIGPDGIISIDRGKLIIKGKTYIGRDGKIFTSRQDILRNGISGLSVNNNSITLGNYRITDGKVYSPDGYFITGKGKIFEYDPEEVKNPVLIYDFANKTKSSTKLSVDSYYTEKFQKLRTISGTPSEPSKVTQSIYSQEFYTFLARNGMLVNEQTGTVYNKEKFIRIKDGNLIIFSSSKAPIIKFRDGKILKPNGDVFDKGSYRQDGITVTFKNGKAELSNDFKVTSEGFLETPTGGMIHVSLFCINQKGNLVEPMR